MRDEAGKIHWGQSAKATACCSKESGLDLEGKSSWPSAGPLLKKARSEPEEEKHGHGGYGDRGRCPPDIYSILCPSLLLCVAL